MYWFGPHLGVWGWAFGLGSLAFWVLVVVAIIALVRSFTRGSQRPAPPYQGYAGGPSPYGQPGPAPYGQPGPAAQPGPHHPPAALTPEQLLAERFARGEIDEDEFRQRLGTLRAMATPPGAAAPPPGPAAPPPGTGSPGPA